MAKNKKKKKGGYKPPIESKQQIVESIVAIAEKINTSEEPGSLWGELHKAFLKSSVDSAVAAKVIMHKDIDELQIVIGQLQSGCEVELTEKKEVVLPTLTHEEQIEALRVFRKRVKFMKLDRETKLGVGPLTTGRKADFDSTTAPHGYPPEVWDALVTDGQLIYDGDGFYRAKE